MNFRAICCAALLGASTLAPQAHAQARNVNVGTLECNVAGGLGLIITSSKEMRCAFNMVHGRTEYYYGTIRKFGIDIGGTDRGKLVWQVFAPTGGTLHGALAGDYIGGTASASIGAGVGANALVGGFNRSVVLQPLSVESNTGFNIAGGVANLTLRRAD
jgi:hypothetical protein